MNAIDPWEDARQRARGDVAQALARKPWVCATCGHENDPAAADCASCGTSRVSRAGRFDGVVKPALIVVAVLAALGAGAALIVPALQDDAGAERARQQTQAQRLAEQEAARQRVEMRAHTATGPRRRSGEDALAYRARLVDFAVAQVTRDARARVAAGRMEGPVKGTWCRPHPKSAVRTEAERDPGLQRGRYYCIAYKRTAEVQPLGEQQRVGYFGQPFYVVADYPAGKVTWCRLIPRAGEGGKTLAAVLLPEPCRDPPGPG